MNLVLQYQAIELLPMLSENKETDTYSEEKELTEKEFRRAISAIKEIDFSELRINGTKELFVYAAQNDKLIRKWLRLGDAFDRGLAQDLPVSDDDMYQVMYVRRMVSELQDRIDFSIRLTANHYFSHETGVHVNDPEYTEYTKLKEILDEMSRDMGDMDALKRECILDVGRDRKKDIDELEKYYRLGKATFTHNINNVKKRQKAYSDLGLFQDPEVQEEYETTFKNTEGNDKDYKLMKCVDRTLAFKGDERLIQYGMDELNYNAPETMQRWNDYMRRRAKGKFILRAKADSFRKNESFKTTLQDLKEGKRINTKAFVKTLRELIIKDEDEYRRMETEFIKKPEKYMARISLLKTVNGNFSVLMKHKEKLGLSEKDLNALLASNFLCDDVETRNAELLGTYTTEEGCLMAPEDMQNESYRKKMGVYREYIKRQKTEESNKKHDNILDALGNYNIVIEINTTDPLDVEISFLQNTIDASQTILSLAEKELEKAWTDFDGEAAFTEDAFEEYKKNWLKKYDMVSRYHDKIGLTYIPEDQVKLLENRRTRRNALRSQKDRFQSRDYKTTVKELFKAKEKGLTRRLRKRNADLDRSNGYSEADFNKDLAEVKEDVQSFINMLEEAGNDYKEKSLRSFTAIMKYDYYRRLESGIYQEVKDGMN